VEDDDMEVDPEDDVELQRALEMSMRSSEKRKEVQSEVPIEAAKRERLSFEQKREELLRRAEAHNNIQQMREQAIRAEQEKRISLLSFTRVSLFTYIQRRCS
jgi:hypothetical protein